MSVVLGVLQAVEMGVEIVISSLPRSLPFSTFITRMRIITYVIIRYRTISKAISTSLHISTPISTELSSCIFGRIGRLGRDVEIYPLLLLVSKNIQKVENPRRKKGKRRNPETISTSLPRGTKMTGFEHLFRQVTAFSTYTPAEPIRPSQIRRNQRRSWFEYLGLVHGFVPAPRDPAEPDTGLHVILYHVMADAFPMIDMAAEADTPAARHYDLVTSMLGDRTTTVDVDVKHGRDPYHTRLIVKGARKPAVRHIREELRAYPDLKAKVDGRRV